MDSAAEAPGPGRDRTFRLSRLRRRIGAGTIAARRTAPHVWTSVEVDYEAVAQVRRRHGEAFEAQEGFSLGYLPFVAAATLDALAAFPDLNSSLDVEGTTQTLHAAVHLGVAVDLNRSGLLVVVVRDAAGMSLRGVARATHTLAGGARGGTLRAEEVGRTTFTITNPGSFGSYLSAPIINLPNVAILGVDGVARRPVVVSRPDGAEEVAVRHTGHLGLSWDHRAFDGSTATLFLGHVRRNLQEWDWERRLDLAAEAPAPTPGGDEPAQEES